MLMCAFRPRPVRTACATHSRLITGSMPGNAASTKLTWRVRLGAEIGGGAGEQFGVADHLGVDFQADDDLPGAGAAFDGCRSWSNSARLSPLPLAGAGRSVKRAGEGMPVALPSSTCVRCARPLPQARER